MTGVKVTSAPETPEEKTENTLKIDALFSASVMKY